MKKPISCYAITVLTLFATTGSAAVLTVDTTSDSGLLSNCAAPAGDCSLRGAVTRANQDAAFDQIQFGIPTSQCSGGVCNVNTRIGGDITINQPIEIDGSTQSGYTPNSLTAAAGPVNTNWVVRLDMRNLIIGASTALRGVKIIYGGVFTSGSPDQIIVEGSHIGPEIVLPNTRDGFLSIQAVNFRVGGLLPAQRNVLAQGMSGGVLNGSGLIQGNLIGIQPDGKTVFSSERGSFNLFGLSVTNGPTQAAAGTMVVGGTDVNARNYVAGFGCTGLGSYFTGWPGRPVRVQGNYFGLAGDGTAIPLYCTPLGGVDVVVGGLQPGAGNVFANIAFGQILHAISGRVTYLSNSAFANRYGSMFIRPAFFPYNDPNDADQDIQNYPEIFNFGRNGAQISVGYGVDTASTNATYPLTVQFFKADGLDGAILLHTDVYSTPQALKSLQFTLPVGVTWDDASDILVATANPPEVGAPSIYTVYPSTLEFVNSGPLLVGVATPVIVRMRTTGPFTPKGEVLIRAGGQHCFAPLVPDVDPSTAIAQCSINLANSSAAVTVLADFSNSPEINVPFVPISRYQPFFAPQISRITPAVLDTLFCDGFESLLRCASSP
jgi:hypothetical protein